MTPEEALHLIRQGEGQRVEFKESFSAEDKAIETLAAFANAEGGTVFFGVRNDGRIVGVSLGANTREKFSSKLRVHTSPLPGAQTEPLSFSSQIIVAVTVEKAARGEVFAAFDRFRIRVDKTNQNMSAEEIRARLVQGQSDWSEERDRPNFEVSRRALKGLEAEFEPMMAVQHVSGDRIARLEWRFRGPRFAMEWRQASGSALDRTHFVARFDLSQPPLEDDKVGLNEMGFEIRFHWRGRSRSELHRWTMTRQEFPAPRRVHWDIGEEILPPLYFDDSP